MRTRTTLLLLAAALSVLAVGIGSAATPVAADDRVVVVQPGDTLGGIAVRVGVPVEVLAKLNGLTNPDHIVVGQKLRLKPAQGSSTPVSVSPTHRVAAGETLSDIAVRYRTTLAELARLNGIADPSYIRAGDVLRLPSDPGRSAPPGATATTTHRVAAGETLSDIAVRYRTTVAELARLNGIADPSYIRAGDVLTIPSASSAISGPATPASIAEAAARHEAVRRMIVDEAARLGVPAPLALALAWQESGWQADLVSAAGAIGAMQLLPATAEWVGAEILHEPVDVGATRQNVRAGVALLGFYLDRYDGNRTLALAAYYQGMTATDRHGVYPASRAYIASILALEARFAG